MPLKNRFAELQEEISEWRQDFHAHPEILFETHRTSKIVEQKLKQTEPERMSLPVSKI